MLRTLSVLLASLFLGSLLLLASPPPAPADDDDDNHRLRAVPFAFVGTVENCGVAGSNIVTAAWLGGMGLPDNGGQNTTSADLVTNPNKKDRHLGLLLSKNGPTGDCSAPGAEITGFRKNGTITELGFDVRKGGHCGAGAPRFSVIDENGTSYFFGCVHGAKSPAPQDPLEWERVRFIAPTPGSEGFVFGVTRVQSLFIVHDEGTDTPLNDTEGVGLAVLDNIDINGKLIKRGRGIATGPDRDDDDDDD